MSVINRIIVLLNEKGLKQTDLCSFLEINTSTFTTWKNRDTDPPAKYILRICEFMGVTPYQLLSDELNEMGSISLDDDEKLLLSYYKDLSEKDKGIIIGEVKMLATKNDENRKDDLP